MSRSASCDPVCLSNSRIAVARMHPGLSSPIRAPRPPAGTVATEGTAGDNSRMRRDLFLFDEATSVDGWAAIDDRVMGGVSRSRLRHEPDGHAVFEGELSLEQDGGFASVRSRPLEPGLPPAAAYLLEVRGDGKRYRLSVRTEEAVDGVSYQAAFETTSGAWTLVRLPVSGFAARFRGRTVTGAPPLDPVRVSQLGLMIADRQAGRFALAIRSIRSE